MLRRQGGDGGGGVGFGGGVELDEDEFGGVGFGERGEDWGRLCDVAYAGDDGGVWAQEERGCEALANATVGAGDEVGQVGGHVKGRCCWLLQVRCCCLLLQIRCCRVDGERRLQ